MRLVSGGFFAKNIYSLDLTVENRNTAERIVNFPEAPHCSRRPSVTFLFARPARGSLARALPADISPGVSFRSRPPSDPPRRDKRADFIQKSLSHEFRIIRKIWMQQRQTRALHIRHPSASAYSRAFFSSLSPAAEPFSPACDPYKRISPSYFLLFTRKRKPSLSRAVPRHRACTLSPELSRHSRLYFFSRLFLPPPPFCLSAARSFLKTLSFHARTVS